MTHRPVCFEVKTQHCTTATIKTTKAGKDSVGRIGYRDTEANDLTARVMWPEIGKAVEKHRDADVNTQYSAIIAVMRDALSAISGMPLISKRGGPSTTGDDTREMERKLTEYKQRVMHLVIKRDRAVHDKLPAAELCAIESELQEQKVSRLRLQRAYHRRSKKLVYQQTRTLLYEIGRLRVLCPHTMHKVLEGVLQPEPDVLSNVVESPDISVMYAHFRCLAEDDGLPVPAEDGSFDAFITKAANPSSGSLMMVEITAQDVFNAACPVNKHSEGKQTACQAVGLDCVLCSMEAEAYARWQPGDAETRPPAQHCALNSTSAAGSDGSQPAFYRFTQLRGSTAAQRLQLRMAMCQTIASVFNRWLKEKCVPTSAGALHAEITALLKKGAPGKPADPLNPKDSRGIAVGNSLMKLFSLIMVKRLTHWVTCEKILDPDQIAYLPFQGAESLVHSAIETISEVRGRNKFIAASFYDISAAFDSVKHSALLYVLRKSGLPDDFLVLLKQWFSNRTASVKVNGKTSAAFPLLRGLPQGEPLSPLLWNIFFNGLLRYIQHNVRGVKLRSSKTPLVYRAVKQAYADDLLILVESKSLAKVQEKTKEALKHVFTWARAWGITINTKPNKTEAMLFSPGFRKGDDSAALCSSVPNAGLSPINVGPHPDGSGDILVHWVASYRYLGCTFSLDMDMDPLLQRKIGLLKAADIKLFTGNKSIRNMSNAHKLELANQLVRSQINYLVSTLSTKKEHTDQLDVALRAVGRHIFNIPFGTSNKLVEAETPGIPALGVIISNSIRALQTLKHLPAPFDQGPAARLAAFLEAADGNTGTLVGRIKKDLADALRKRERAVGEPVTRAILPEIFSRFDIYSAVRVFNRTFNHDHLWADHRFASCFDDGKSTDSLIQEAARAALRPPPLQQDDHLAALHCLGFRPTAEEIAQWSYGTPLSVVASGCSGSLLNFVSIPFNSVLIMRTRLGRASFAYHPWASAVRGCATKERWLDPDEDYPDDAAPQQTLKGLIGAYNASAPCPLCGDENDDPFHLFNECSDYIIGGTREALRLSVLDVLDQLADKIGEVILKSTTDHGLLDRVASAVAELKRVVDLTRRTGVFHETDINFVAYHMITAIPFSARLPKSRVLGADMPAMPLATALGELFDATVLQNTYLHPVANLIAKWATRTITYYAGLRGRRLREHWGYN